MTHDGVRALGYVRVSTSEQAEHGYGIAAQEAALREWATQTGARLVSVLRDEGATGSGDLESRVGLSAALAKLESGVAEVLVVARLDRLARDLLVQETVIARLDAADRSVVSVAEDVDSQDPTRVLVRQVLGAISQYERSVIRGRMEAGKAAKKATGGYVGGRPRYGKRAEDRSLVTDPAEDEVVRLVRSARAEGLSYRRICERLEQADLRPRSSSRWHPAVVRRIALRAE